MTASAAVFPPGFRVTDANDNPVSGATIEFYNAATTTPKTVYADSDLITAIGTSVTTDAGGYPTSGGNKTLVYVDTSYKVIIKDALGAVIAVHDRVPGPTGSGGTSTSTAATTFGMGVGDVKISASATPDAGFIRLKETAQSLLKTAYPDLNAWAAAQGYPWGSTTTNFSVPPAAGYMLRFAASDTSVDPDGPRAAGSTQADQYEAHTHTATATDAGHTHGLHTANTTGVASGGGGWGFTGTGSNSFAPGGVTPQGTTDSGNASITVTVATAGGTASETRGKNVAFHADMLAVPALVSAALVGAAGLAYKFNSTTSPGSVTTGTLAFNNATLTSATALYVHETDANSTNLAAVLQGLPSGTLLWMAKVGAPATWIAATLSSTATDAGTYDSFTLSTVATSATAMANGDLMTITAMRAGADGAPNIYVQSGTPSVSNGSIWIRTTDGEVFKCLAGTWTDQSFTVKGAAGVGVPTGGSTGQYLKKNSGTDFDTSWATVSGGGGGGSNSTFDFRLTLASATPIMTTNQTAKTTVYLTPYVGNGIALYDGSAWSVLTSAEVSISTSGWTASRPYDIFAYNNAGTLTLEAVVWTNDTTRATALVKQDGVYVKSGATTRRYCGTVYSNASSQVDWQFGSIAASGGAGIFGVYNAYNRVNIASVTGDTTDSWTYGSGAANTWRAANASTTMRATFVVGLAEDALQATYACYSTANAGGYCAIGVGYDSTTAKSGSPAPITSSATIAPMAITVVEPSVGWHYVSAIEMSSVSANATFNGDAGIPSFLQNALCFSFRM